MIATETQIHSQYTFKYLFVFEFIYITNTKHIMLISIPVVTYELESSATFYNSKEDENTHVLDTTAKLPKWRPRRDHDGKHARQSRGRSSRAHARLCKFTSGSRPSSSSRPILRSVMSPEMRPKSFGTFEKRVPG